MNAMQKTVYANVLGQPYDTGSNISELLAAQMRSRVKWYDCIENMIKSSVQRYIEIGPSNVLTKLVEAKGWKRRCRNVFNS